jgi:tRNA(Ile)-lysidine synthase TilS/MesJ
MSASNIGCDDEMEWIQINPELFSSFSPDSRYLVGVSGGRDSIVLLHRLLDLGYAN